jgi:hypothetical protein
MARRLYGSSPADFTFDGDKAVPNVRLAVGTRSSAGVFTRVTAGLEAFTGGAVTVITSDANGEVRFYATDQPITLWVTTIDALGNLGTTWYAMQSVDIGALAEQAITQTTVNAAVASALAPYNLQSIAARLSVLEGNTGQVTPGAPVNVAATLSGTTATVTFEAPFTNPTAVTSYIVTLSPSSSAGGSAVTQTITAGTTYTVTFANLVRGVTYGVSVVAAAGGARGPAGVATVVVPAAPPATGSTPTTNVSITPGVGRLDVTWTLPANAVSTIASRNGTDTGGGGAYSTQPIPVPDNTQDFTYLDPAQTYLITVTITLSDGSTVVGTATGKPLALPADTTTPDPGTGTGGGGTTAPVAGVVTTSDNSVRRAQEFVDSCGVSIHLTYPAYSDLTKVKTALDYLGINHVRDGLGTGRNSIFSFVAGQMPYLRFCMVVDDRDWPSGYTPAQQVAEFSGGGTASTNFLPYLELIEGPNERDLAGAQVAAANYLRARIDPFRAKGVKVASPSLADTNSDAKYQQMGAMNVDFVTFHPYPGGDRMQNDTIMSTMSRNGRYIMTGRTNVPTISTEQGFATSTNGDGGKSMPPSGPFTHQHLRIYLESFKGLPGKMWSYRTYKYELKDQGTGTVEDTFGFFDSNWNAKPAATAVRNMLAVMRDSSPSSLSFTPAAPPSYTVSGIASGSPTRTLLTQKASGAWQVAIWRQQVTWNGSTTLVPAGENVTISWAGSTTVNVYKPSASAVTTSTTTGSSVTVNATFDPVIVEIAAFGTPPTTTSSTDTVSSGYTPASAPSLAAWWKINAAAVDGANLGTYPAGNAGTTAMTPGGTTRAVYRSNGFAAGKPAAEFTPDTNLQGGPAYVDGTVLNGATAATIAGTFMIPASGTLPSGQQMTIAGRELSYKLTVEADLRPKLLLSTNGTSWAVNATTANALSRGVPYVYTIVIGGGNAVLRINGVQFLSVPFSGALASPSAVYTVGGLNAAGAYPLRGFTGDMVLSTAALSGTGLSDLEGYLAVTAGASLG